LVADTELKLPATKHILQERRRAEHTALYLENNESAAESGLSQCGGTVHNKRSKG